MSKSFFKIGKLSGKGAAAVICFCLAAVAAVGVYTYNKSELTEEKQKLVASDDAASPDEFMNAEAVQNDVPILPAEDMMPDETADVDSDEIVPTAEDTPDTAPEETTSPFEDDKALAEGIIVRPLDGDIICAFSNGELVKSETLDVWKTHDGIDIAGELGEPVRAAAAGTVLTVYDDPLWGNCVVIEHKGGYESYYFGLSDNISVCEGEEVSAGSEIAEVGNTADCEAAEETHLHFGLKKNGKWVDPAEALSGLGS